MVSYWKRVHDRTWQLALKAVGLDGERAVMVWIIQGALALLIFMLNPHGDVATRVLTAIVPFLLFPLVYVAKLPLVPPILSDEANNELLAERQRLADFLDAFAWSLSVEPELHHITEHAAPRGIAGPTFDVMEVILHFKSTVPAPIEYCVTELRWDFNGVEGVYAGARVGVLIKDQSSVLVLPHLTGDAARHRGKAHIAISVLYGPPKKLTRRRSLMLSSNYYVDKDSKQQVWFKVFDDDIAADDLPPGVVSASDMDAFISGAAKSAKD